MLQRFLHITVRILLGLLLLIILIWLAIQTSPVQNWLVGIATSKLSKAIGTEVRVQEVGISFFDKLNMKGVLVRDQNKDTLLHAGALKVRITDYFFLKNKADITYIGLEDAVVKLQRLKDSTWNYQFIVDYFAGTDSIKVLDTVQLASTPSKSNKKPFQLGLKKIDLKKVSFLQNDLWVGERMFIKVGSLFAETDQVDFNKTSFLIKEVTIDNPYFSLLQLDGLRPPKPKNKVDTGLSLNPGHLYLQIADIQLKNGTFYNHIDAENNDSPLFDGEHIRVTHLNGRVKNFSFREDTISADIQLSAKERCGLELRQLKTNFTLTPQLIELAKLTLETPRSRLTNFYSMKFKDFKSMNDFNNNVVLQARLVNSQLHLQDLSYFAPELKNIAHKFWINGTAKGTLSKLDVQSLNVKYGENTYLTGNVNITGLPDIDNTFFQMQDANLQTNAFDFYQILPNLKKLNTPDLPAMGKVWFRGGFNGTIHQFATQGMVTTALGSIQSNILLSLPLKGEPAYKGSIQTNSFNVGKLMKDSSFGRLSFTGKIEGSSFSIASMKSKFEGKIDSIQYSNYTYSNITAKGNFQKQQFIGEINVDDPNLNIISNVEIDLTGEKPNFNILSDISKLHLQELGFLKERLDIESFVDLNFKGNTIDDFLGTAKLVNTKLTTNSENQSFDSLVLTSYFDQNKHLELKGNNISAAINGEYNIMDLQGSFQSLLSRYFPAYISAPKTNPKNQNFNFSIQTNYIEPYAQFFNKNLFGLNDINLTGTINTQKSEMDFELFVPYLKFNDITILQAEINAKGLQDSLVLLGTTNGLVIGDSLDFPNTSFSIRAAQDHAVVGILTSSNNSFENAELLADVFTLPDGVRIQFRPSNFVLNQKNWTIDKKGELVIRKNFLFAKDLRLSQGFQEINLYTKEEDGGNTQYLMIDVKDVVLGDLVSMFLTEPRLEGATTGNIRIDDFFGKMTAKANFSIDQFNFNEDSIGLVKLSALYESANEKLSYSIASSNPGYDFEGDGSYQLNDSISPLSTRVVLRDAKIDLLEPYLEGLFSNIKGRAKGEIMVFGNPNSPEILGTAVVKKAGLLVDYTKVYYEIDSLAVQFKEDGLYFGEFTIKDPYNNTGTVKGKLLEKGFANMIFDFELATKKLLLINTTAQDNSQFYGKAIGEATLSLKGPESNALMSIVAKANDSSSIVIPNSSSKASGDVNFIVFKEYGSEIKKEETKSNFNLTVDLDVTANNLVKIDVILDELTGDIIKATGNGRLRIRAGTSEDLTMSGRYNIEKGSYDFNFQSIIRKPFILRPESGNYIEWSGDPYRAQLKIDAVYTAERISFADLVGNQSFSGAVKAYRGDVYVIAELREFLTKPAIRFKLDFEQGAPIKSEPEFEALIRRIESEENAILTQVAYLIVFNSFAPYGTQNQSTALGSTSLASISINTISSLITNEVNKVLSNVLYKITGDKSWRFDLATSVYSSSNIFAGAAGNNNQLDRSKVNLKLGKSFLNDQIIFTFGSDLDFNTPGVAQTGQFQWLPDFNLELILSRDRKLRAIIFVKNNLDISGTSIGRRNRQGVSISYKQDFNRFFGKKEDEIDFKPKQKAENEPAKKEPEIKLAPEIE